MLPPEASSPGPPAARLAQARALENLRFVRETIDRAASFTAVPGWGTALVGLTALPTAALAARQATPGRWLAVWLAEAALAGTLGVGSTFAKARREGASLLSGPGGRFLLALAPPLAAGALLTLALLRASAPRLLPGVWLLLYGIGLFSAGAFSLRLFRTMGLAFLAAGAATLFVPEGFHDLCLAGGFGGLHLLFGVRIARRHGG
ncbi:MAG TPA: hypothetical protein VFI25_07025 [Planctomycetota bacterium]|jgi:hypothetical protein|nr:hypothetical protein [Planctomycetota bacterium]